MSTVCSIFSQLLQLFPRIEFERLVRETRAERHARGVACWSPFVAMLFGQLGRAHSLREICGGLASCEGTLSHLGIQAPKRSSLAYANEHRPWTLDEHLFSRLLERCRAAVALPRKFRFKHKLVSLDSTVIDLCVSLFDWAHFRRTKGAINLHLVLDHDGYLPCFAVVTEGQVADVKVAQGLTCEPDTIVVDDRGYNDYRLVARWTADRVWCVTRMKDNAVYAVVEERPVPQHRHILKDQTIRFTGTKATTTCPVLLRRVEVWNPEKEEGLVFLTNHFTLGATPIAAIYQDRWQIELFFKALKQNLKIKTFVGTSANAVKIQVWTALIALLILRYLQLKARIAWSLSNLVALLRMNLFTHRDLWTWLHQPFETPPGTLAAPHQAQLAWEVGQQNQEA